jgi:hypothetical protein
MLRNGAANGMEVEEKAVGQILQNAILLFVLGFASSQLVSISSPKKRSHYLQHLQ